MTDSHPQNRLGWGIRTHPPETGRTRQADADGGPRRRGADRSSCLMPYGNSDEQLFFLPGKTVALCGPQFIVSGRSPAVPSQVHSPLGPGGPALQTVNVGWESSVAYSISF